MELFFLVILLLLVNASRSGGEEPRLPVSSRLQLPPGQRFALTVHRLWIEPVARVGKRDGIKVHTHLEVVGAQGQPLEYQVGFRLPSGVLVKSRASRYFGPAGALVARARTRPVQNLSALYRDLWIFVPFGAFDLSRGVHTLSGQLEVWVDGVHLGDTYADFLLAQPEEDPEERTPVGAEDFAIVEAAQGEGAHCAICNEHVTGEAYVCPRCETLHHLDCWQYNEGCATYGCTESR